MNKEDIQEASKILFEHRLNKTGLSSLKNLEPQTIDEAYELLIKSDEYCKAQQSKKLDKEKEGSE